ncbi:hypothetical protein J1614_009059 [Plenodomus biglobosus]|nr:hypothetical protein J1614_009059 [Plenodomus biglobosus]
MSILLLGNQTSAALLGHGRQKFRIDNDCGPYSPRTLISTPVFHYAALCGTHDVPRGWGVEWTRAEFDPGMVPCVQCSSPWKYWGRLYPSHQRDDHHDHFADEQRLRLRLLHSVGRADLDEMTNRTFVVPLCIRPPRFTQRGWQWLSTKPFPLLERSSETFLKASAERGLSLADS